MQPIKHSHGEKGSLAPIILLRTSLAINGSIFGNAFKPSTKAYLGSGHYYYGGGGELQNGSWGGGEGVGGKSLSHAEGEGRKGFG